MPGLGLKPKPGDPSSSQDLNSDKQKGRWKSWLKPKRESAGKTLAENHDPQPLLSDATIHHSASSAGADQVQSSASEQKSASPDNGADKRSLWEDAYERFRTDKPAIAQAYEKLLLDNSLAATLHDGKAAATVTPNRRQLMEDAITAGLVRMEANEITLHVAGHKIDLQDQLKFAAGLVGWAKDWISDAVKASPEASMIWAGVCLVLPLMTNPAQAREANEQGFTYVTTRMKYYVEMESLLLPEKSVSEGVTEEFTNHIVNLYRSIIEFQAQTVLRYFRSRFGTILRDMFALDSWKSMLEIVKDSESIIDRESRQISTSLMRKRLAQILAETDRACHVMEQHLDIAKEQLLVATEHRDMTAAQLQTHKEEIEDRKREKMNACLRVFLLEGSDVKDQIEERVENTCQWFLKQPNYKTWLAAESGPLLVSADPGCGKSVLAKYLVDHALPREATICHFFFRDGIQNTIKKAFCSIIHQLFTQKPELIRHAILLYEVHQEKLVDHFNFLWDIFESSISDDDVGSVIIVLDALDECLQDASNMATLSRHLQSHFEKSPHKLKILMTSRPYHDTIGGVQDLEEHFPNIRIRGEEASEEIRFEIDAVIEYRVQRMKTIKSDLKAHLIQHMKKIPHRTYLWFTLIVGYLDRPEVKKTMKGLEQAISTLPQTVDKAYEAILERSKFPDVARKALCILLAAYRPLKLREMQTALTITPDMQDLDDLDLDDDESFDRSLRETCGLFITVSNGEVYFLHQTAKEFLLPSTANPSSVSLTLSKWAHTFTEDEAHSVLAVSCIVYLCFPELMVLEDSRKSPFEDWRSAYGDESFHGYSISFWSDHVRQCDFVPSDVRERYDDIMCNPHHPVCQKWTLVLPSLDLDFIIMNQFLGITGGKKLYFYVTRLAIQSMLGHKSSVKQTILAGASVDETPELGTGIRPLLAACIAGYYEIAIFLVENKADLWLRCNDRPSSSAVEVAIVQFNRHESEHWLRYRPPRHFRPDDQRHQQLKLLELFLARGLDPNASFDIPHTYPMRKEPLLNCVYDAEFVRLLLNAGANAHQLGSMGRTSLFSKSMQSTTILLEECGVDPRKQDQNGKTALHSATSAETVSYLLKHGADVDARDQFKRTPLFRAHVEKITALLAGGAEVNARDSLGLVALHLAYDVEQVKALVVGGADIYAVDDEGCSVLCGRKSGQALEVLINDDVDVNLIDKYGRTALFYCTHDDMVDVLVKHGANVDATDHSGKTALFRCDGTFVMDALVKHGININATDHSGRTALFYCEHSYSMNALVKHGINVETKDFNNQTAVFHCKWDGDIDILVEKGININTTDKKGQTPLMIALQPRFQDYRVAKRLMHHGADVNSVDQDGKSPIFHLFQNYDDRPTADMEGIIKELFDLGANFNVVDNDGNTALHILCASRDEIAPTEQRSSLHFDRIVTAALRARACPQIVDHAGQTVLSIACLHDSGVLPLLQHGARIPTAEEEHVNRLNVWLQQQTKSDHGQRRKKFLKALVANALGDHSVLDEIADLIHQATDEMPQQCEFCGEVHAEISMKKVTASESERLGSDGNSISSSSNGSESDVASVVSDGSKENWYRDIRGGIFSLTTSI